MYKKRIIGFILMIIILIGLYAWKTKTSAPNIRAGGNVAVTQQVFDNSVHLYDAEHLSEKCNLNSPMACAVETAVKCTLNPDLTMCADAKLPKFIFMTDDALGRPSHMSFQIAKIKPINNELIEIHTDGTCDGNWFGLCNGRIIYVLVPSGDAWRVKDIYAIEI